jgi:hypothetical protein
MSAILKTRLQRRTVIEDEYLSLLWSKSLDSRGATVPRTDEQKPTRLSPLQQSRLSHVRMYAYPGNNVIDLEAIRQSLAYALWWYVLIERTHRAA